MDFLRQYIYAVISGAITCGILMALSEKAKIKPIMKLLCGLFLAFTVIRPITRLDLAEWVAVSLPYSQEAAQISSLGENLSSEALEAIIKESTEAYILDKATALNVSLEAEITVYGNPPVPTAVWLSGEVSPYAKQQLEAILTEDLGIPKENLQWIG